MARPVFAASIRTRLLILVMCVALPCAAATLWAVAAAYSRERASTSQSLRETTRALSLAVGRELGSAEAVARTLAVSPDLANHRLDLFYSQARSATEAGGGWTVLLDAEGMVLNTALPFGAELPPGRRTSGSRYTDARGDQVDISAMFQGPLAGRRAVAVTVVSQAADKPYEISVVVPPERIQRVLDDQRLPSGWIAAVIDQKGVIVARIPDAQRWVGAPITPRMREALAHAREGLFTSVSLDGIPTTAFYNGIPGTPWSLAIAVPNEVLRQDALSPLLSTAAIALAMLALALALARWMSRKLLAPARALQRVARALEQREGDVSYSPQGVQEFDIAGAAMATAAERLTHANDDLHKRVDDAIALARAAQHKVEAAQRQEALKRLTGGVAHDVNNLLAVISTSVTLLERRPDDPQRGKRLDAIRRAVATGRELTQKLLSYSRQRTHNVSLLDLREWLPAQIPRLREKLGPESMVELDVDSSTDRIEVDSAELLVALLNLAANAAHAMGRSGTLRISAGNHVHEGRSEVWIGVADTGPGIPVELHGRIFEPFFTTGEASGHTGLGLLQVQSFCELSHGSIRVEQPERGAAFTMVLPSAGRAVDVHRGSVAGGRTQATRLLYVEDNIDVGEPTKEVLEDLGYQVSWALTADAALAMAGQAEFEIVLSDFSLPGSMNGLELGLHLRSARPGLPYLILTGYAEQGNRAAAEGFDVLYKPCPVEQLELALERLVGAALTR